MKRNVLTISALALTLFAQAQMTLVDNGGLFYVGGDALVYNGGGIQTKGTGTIDIHGNVMVVGNASDSFKTLNSSGADLTTAGDNIILRLNDPANHNSSTYGQLYINGLPQENITGFVTKEYLSAKHGSYQQMGLPFYNKTLQSLSDNLKPGALTDNRWTRSEVLNWNNARIVSDNIPLSSTTSTLSGTNNKSQPFSTKSDSYYMVGTANWDPSVGVSAATALPNGAAAYNVYSIKGVPVANQVTETLQNAGLNIDYGVNGTGRNAYTETYNSYLGDPWVAASGTWTNSFGRNIYQFGNPYLTNLDLSQIVGTDGNATITDGNNITNLLGIRYNSSAVAFDRVNGTTSTSSSTSIVTFDSAGTAIGDTVPVIKPMGFFVLKLSDNTQQSLNFDTLRRFAYSNRAGGTNYDVTASRAAKSSGHSVKQIGLIALDAAGKEIGRTYYAVYADAVTGQTTASNAQATASSANVIGSFEEKKTGGLDTTLQNTYWLYINTANENDYKGKEIPVRVYSDAVKSIKVEIKENATLLADNATLSSGESFYVGFGTDSPKTVKQGEVLPLGNTSIALYYGTPERGILSSSNVNKPSETIVVRNPSTADYLVIFDPTWKSAEVSVYDLSGKLISSNAKVSTKENFKLNIPAVNGVYIVKAVSDKGSIFEQKIIK